MKIYKKSILPLGFKASGVACGLKKSGSLDLALFYCDVPAKASCKFTTNKVEAAPIKINKKYLKNNHTYRAIVVNSGNANCFTGGQGMKDAEDTARAIAAALNTKREDILIASTGIIGKRLPVGKIKKAMPRLLLGLSRQGINEAKKAIITTDSCTKEITAKFNLGNNQVTICGVAKGSGMIAPHLATMLCFILTDANITQNALNKALKISVDSSFNCITVDGCMSTNDSVMVLANGASGNTSIDTHKNFNSFTRALSIVCLELAKMIIQDAEGATKFIRIKIDKARNLAEARRVALSIANSDLFKTAVYGENPNYGRIVAAIGASGVDVKEKDLKLRVSPLHNKEINVNVSIGHGRFSTVVYTSDLTPLYIRINAEYN